MSALTPGSPGETSLTISNALLCGTKDGDRRVDIVIEAGEIAAIEAPAPRRGGVIDASAWAVWPGFVDNHVHYREPGQEHKEGFASGSLASAQGGATTVLEIQNNTPYLDSLEAVERKRERVRASSVVDVGFYATAHPGMLSRIGALASVCHGLKIFMTGPKDLAITQHDELRIAFERAAAGGLGIVVHAENDQLVNQGLKRYGPAGAEAYSRARSPAAEIAAVDEALELVEETGAKVHFFHVSTAGAVERIAEAKQAGLQVGASTSPHYLWFDDGDVARLGAVLKCNPSIKSADDRAALRAAVRSGVIDIVSTDHAPHPEDEKRRAFEAAPSGISCADVFMPVMLTLVARGELDARIMVERCSRAPAAWHGFPDRGELKAGMRADLVLTEIDRPFVVTESMFASRAKLSPYLGMELLGRPVLTLVRGRIVVDRR
jgi:dihydroorotase